MMRWFALLMLTPGLAAGQQTAASGARPPVSGTVYDSVAGRPLRGASVQLMGVSDSIAGRSLSAVTDDEGMFASDYGRVHRYRHPAHHRRRNRGVSDAARLPAGVSARGVHLRRGFALDEMTSR
jgi:hypothetical protein